MITESRIKEVIDGAIAEFANFEPFQELLAGRLPRPEMRAFIRNLFLPHYQSTRVLAFEYSVHGGPESELLQHNMLEEMGLDEEGIAHPALLEDLALGAGFSRPEVDHLQEESREQARAYYARQLPFPTLRDVGLAILLESSAFETFLSQHADGIAKSLQAHFGFTAQSLRWFDLHGELDIRHAEEALTVVRGYVEFHRIDDAHFERVARATFAANPFMARYFPGTAPARPVAAATPVLSRSRSPQPTQVLQAQASGGAIQAVTIYRLDIPFHAAFRHAAAKRAASDSVIVRVQDAAGNYGYGEGIAREYVTGESPASMVDFLVKELAQRLIGETSAGDSSFGAVRRRLDSWRAAFRWPNAAVVPNAAFCALELALIDWAFRRSGKSVADDLPPVRESVTYSGVIPAEGPGEVAALARRFVDFGIESLKLKVGVGDDLARLQAARTAAGARVSLRVDANGAWTPDEAIRQLRALQSTRIDYVEQPVDPAAGPAALRRVHEATGIPVIVDESLVTLDDARSLAESGACDVFNVRVSKNGGLTAALAIAEVARQAGLRVQVGAQVGETAILTAAGRHLAAHVPDLLYAEGSFGTLLLEEDIAEQDLRFGPGGMAPALGGPGLGVDVRQDQIERFAVETIEVRG